MNHEICELVNSTRGKQKIVIRGYLLVKDKNRDEKYYWCCEYKDAYSCMGRATTVLEGQEHVLKKFKEHNHAPDASRAEVVQALDTIKRTASQSHDLPVQIIQNTVVNMSQSSYSNMPSREALRKRIAHVRNENIPSQPQSLQDIDVPTHLRTTISGEQFLAREIELDEEKIMIFCTTSNLQHLQEANYWIMDGTFKTMPALFQQMYTIHALVGGENNARDFPMVYTLMTSKSEESYRRLFQELVDLGEETGHHLAPPMILTDFEQAAINAAQSEFPGSINKGCFFHLCQNVWRKIQTLGLAIEYSNDEDFSIKLRYLTALAFLPPSEIPDAFDQIRPLLPESAAELAQYFENNYVRGRIRRELRNGNVVRSPPLFPPGLWSVHELVGHGHPRTQNTVEAWHHRWNTLIGRAHVGVYTILEEMHKEQQRTNMQIESILHGEPRPPQQKYYADREK
nr:5299_t:CDS:1 [Entrophospora candida]